MFVTRNQYTRKFQTYLLTLIVTTNFEECLSLFIKLHFKFGIKEKFKKKPYLFVIFLNEVGIIYC